MMDKDDAMNIKHRVDSIDARDMTHIHARE